MGPYSTWVSAFSFVTQLTRAGFAEKWSGYAALFDYTDAFAQAPVRYQLTFAEREHRLSILRRDRRLTQQRAQLVDEARRISNILKRKGGSVPVPSDVATSAPPPASPGAATTGSTFADW